MSRTPRGFLDLAGWLRCLARCTSWARSLAACTSWSGVLKFMPTPSALRLTVPGTRRLNRSAGAHSGYTFASKGQGLPAMLGLAGHERLRVTEAVFVATAGRAVACRGA